VVDCVVVGAGFAGLRAATVLAEAGRDVVVLEARDRVGGRVMAGEVAGQSIDVGGMWLGPTQKRLDALTAEHGLERYPTWLEGECTVGFRGRFGRAPGEEFDRVLGTPNRLRLLMLSRALDRDAANVDTAEPWAHPRAVEHDSESVASWVAKRTKSEDIRVLMNSVVRAVFCCEARELSYLFFLFYCKAAGGLLVLLAAGPGGAQNLLFRGGLHQSASLLAEGLGDRVRLGTPVTAVHQDGDRVVVVTSSGEEVAAPRAVVAVPPPLAAAIDWQPGLPQNRRRLMERQAMGSTIKAWLAYPEPFWRRSGHNGFLTDDVSPFDPVFDATPPGSPVGLLAGFFESVEGRELAASGPDARKAAAVEVLVRHLGPEAAEPIDYVDQDWTAEQWSRGCYGATMPPGVLTTVGNLIRAPHGRVHWAGTETATEWSGYVEGALQSGERAAAEVLAIRE
jgi:monoamine oxidase